MSSIDSNKASSAVRRLQLYDGNGNISLSQSTDLRRIDTRFKEDNSAGFSDIDVAVNFTWNAKNLTFELASIENVDSFSVIVFTGTGKLVFSSNDCICSKKSVQICDPSYMAMHCGHFVIKFDITYKEGKFTSILQDNKPNGNFKECNVGQCQGCNVFNNPFRDRLRNQSLAMEGSLNIMFRGAPFTNVNYANFLIKVDDGEFYVHKPIICCQSMVFDGMFNSEMQEPLDGSVDVVGYTACEMRAFLEVLYERIRFAIYATRCRELLAIYKLADKYNVGDITSMCIAAFDRVEMTPEEFCSYVSAADLLNLPFLFDRCARTAKQYPEKFWQEEEFLNFARENTKAVCKLFARLANLN